MEGHLYDPEICYMIKTVMCRENHDVLLMTLLKKSDRVSLTLNAAQHQEREGSEKKGRVEKLLCHYRSYFSPCNITCKSVPSHIFKIIYS